MITGIGVDLCQISRIQKILDHEGLDGPFFQRAFTVAEQTEAKARSDKAAFYASRFASKEAVFKALSSSGAASFDMRLIETLHDEFGRPYVHIAGAIKSIIAESGICSVHISVTTDGDYAEAFAIAEK